MELICKVIGSVCVLGATGYYAVNVNRSIETRNRELRKLYSILLQLKSEIQYMCNPLPDCFQKLCSSTKEPFSAWMTMVTEKLEEKEFTTFSTVWKEGLEYLYRISCLESEDIEPLQELADKLGEGDVSAQIKAIDYALLHIEENRIALEGVMAQKKKVVTTLSLFCGFITLIFLL